MSKTVEKIKNADEVVTATSGLLGVDKSMVVKFALGVLGLCVLLAIIIVLKVF